ncbi:hypothetical protein GOP47_0009403 [Adiantum capillus-veneris]|uniref:Mitochondrial carrier protein n=1 Tax=Adiantum capillus-veneris TaxID=13818 RepID=A0A9D4UXQ7_ADICA|nr:hypothetical protein GOP47_0009403 [Adiantum capillus-veneris]
MDSFMQVLELQRNLHHGVAKKLTPGSCKETYSRAKKKYDEEEEGEQLHFESSDKLYLVEGWKHSQDFAFSSVGCATGGAKEMVDGGVSSSLSTQQDGAAVENNKTHTQRMQVQAGIAGFATTVLLQPFDVVKTHIQGSHTLPPPGIRESVRLIVARQGISGLWAGTTPAFLRVGLGAGLYFSMLNPILSILSTGNLAASSTTEYLHKKLPTSDVLAAGAITTSITTFVVCPITVLKTRMEYEAMSGVRYPNTMKALVLIARTEGLKGLYSGLVPTILRDAPYSGLYLLLYSTTRRTISEWQDSRRSPHMPVNFLAGAIAGASATILTHPPDVIRTKLQLENREYSSIISSIRHVYQVHGIRGFFAGVLPRAGRRALHQAFAWTIFFELMERS